MKLKKEQPNLTPFSCIDTYATYAFNEAKWRIYASVV